MSDHEKILDLLRRWEELTHAEAEAIQSEAWARLHTVQSAKECLQDQIGLVHDRLLGGRDAGNLADLKSLVARLIKLETDNHAELERRRGKVSAERHAAQRASRRLSQLQQAYSPGHNRQWSTYS